MNSSTAQVVIRDRMTRARIAESVLQALLLPRAQVSLEVKILEVNTDTRYQYGVNFPTSYQLLGFLHLGGVQSLLPNLTNVSSLLAFGSRTNFFGLALGTATLFATYSQSESKVVYDATMLIADGQSANMHVGEKYPIQTAVYTGGTQGGSSAIYNPIGQVTQEDLGLVLKIGAHVNGNGDISLDTEAQYESLGAQVLDTIPIINQRQFKGSVRLREGELAVLAGLDEDDRTDTRNGLMGLSNIPAVKQVLSANTRDHSTTRLLISIKPTITVLPMSSIVSPQYFLGSLRGSRVTM